MDILKHCQILQTVSCVLGNLRAVKFEGVQFNLYDSFMNVDTFYQIYVYASSRIIFVSVIWKLINY